MSAEYYLGKRYPFRIRHLRHCYYATIYIDYFSPLEIFTAEQTGSSRKLYQEAEA